MGTPHRGSSAADFADIVATIAKVAFWQHPNKKLVKALTKDSDLLERNRKSFASISAHLPIGSFVEGKGFLNMGLVGDMTSFQESALINYLDCETRLCVDGYVRRDCHEHS
jgi:hypothetical protein